MKYTMFKKLFFVNLCLLLNIAALAQGKYTGDSNEFNRRLKLKKLPTMRVWDKYGNEHELNKYIRNNQLNAGKPLLLVGYDVFGSYSLKELNELAKSSIPDQYNVLVLCVGDSIAMREKKLTERGHEKEWPKFMVAKILEDDLSLFYNIKAPFSVCTDKDGNILFTSVGFLSVTNSIKLLSQIEAKQIIHGKYWYTKNGDITGKDAADAYYFTELKTDGKRITETLGTRTTVLTEVNYLLKDNVYYYDGIYRSVTETGVETGSGEFKEGVPIVPLKQWYEDGKVYLNYPVNGTGKKFDREGKLIAEISLKNGLYHGPLYTYKNGVKTGDYFYKEGILTGLAREFKDGELVKEYIVLPEYEAYGELINGLQKVKIKGLWGYVDRNGKEVIPPVYEDTHRNFELGIASVKLKGKLVFIDQKGKIITDAEAKKIEANWKFDVKVYQTKSEILIFLQENLVKKVDKRSETSFKSLEPKLKMYQTFNAGEIEYNNIIGVKIKRTIGTRSISVIGKFDKTDRFSARTKYDIRLDYSLVDNKLAFQIKENLRQLAVLNGSKLLLEQIDQLNETELFDQLNSLVKRGRNLEVISRGKIHSVSLTKDRYEINHYHYDKINEVRVTGFDWSKINRITYEKSTNYTNISVWFNNNLDERSSVYGDKKYEWIDLYVSESDAEKVIAILHQIQEINTKLY